MCRDVVRYNVTGWPNLLGHDSLVDADRQLRTFSPLVQYGCARRHELLFLLCAVYVPMCTEQIADVIGPCRPVCERVRRRCQPLLHNFGFSWPAALDCARFPAHNDAAHMCMEGPPVDHDDDDVRPPSDVVTFNTVNDEQQDSATSTNDCLLVYNMSACGAPCVWVGTRDRLISVWMAAVAAVCLSSTLFCASTYVVEWRRVACSERVSALMVACCGLYAVSLLAGIVFSPPTSPCRHDDASLVTSDCMLVFVARYYFWSSCVTWWVVLNVVCLLTSRLRWTETDLRRLTTWLHVVSWSLPAALVVAVLLLGEDVQLDGVLGVCRVRRGTVSHAVLVVTPLLACLVVSAALIAVRLISRHQSSSQTPSVRACAALLASVAVAVICECSTAAAAASIIIYPPVVSVVTAASIMCSGRAQSRSRLERERYDEAMDTSRAATGVDRQSRHVARVTPPHQHQQHQQQQQQQLMRQNIHCSHDFSTACHTHRHPL